MKFKHSLSIFIDNFAVTYKQLLYRLVVSLIAVIIYTVILMQFVTKITGSADYRNLMDGVRSFLFNFVEGHPAELGHATQQIRESFEALLKMVIANRAGLIWAVIGIVIVHLVEKFFAGLGNYATACVINDKMALRANSPFMVTLINNLKPACLYNLMYVPLSFVYDCLCVTILYLVVFKLFALLPMISLLLQIFLFLTLVVIAIAVKMMFTTDWLPSLIRGKMGQKQAFLYTFDRRKKNTFNVLSNFIVLVILIFALNVGALLLTFGVGALLTVPSSYVILLSFEFVNYYDREELKYFVDKNTIIKPEKEHTPTREEFFRGE